MPESDPKPFTATLSNRAVIRRLFRLTWRYRAGCLKVLLIQLVLLSMGIVGLSFTGVGIDYIRHKVAGVPLSPNPLHLAPPEDWPWPHVLGLLAGLILVLALARALLNYSYFVSVNRLVQQQLVVDLRGRVYDRLQRLSFRFFDANTTGSIITRVTSDVQAVRMFVDQVLIQSVIMVISLTVYVTYMASLSPTLTVACLATTPLLWGISAWFSRKIQPAYAHNRTLVEKMVQRLAESVQGIAVTKGFGREAEDRARFDAANQACYDQQRGIFWRVSLFSPAVGFLTRINMMVLLGYGGWLVIRGELPLGAGLVVFVGLLEQFSGQVNNIATIVNSVQQSLIGARRVFEILDAPVEVRNAPDAVRRPRLTGAVNFERVSFVYQPLPSASGPAAFEDEVEPKPVLHDITLDVQAGQYVAILGPTGAGKSVLMSLIPRFYDPTAGRILIDGIDVRRLHLDDLRRNIGIVFQESFLFSNTVAANIAFGHPEATREQIERAARIAAAHEFITALPQGYDTVLGESGSSLSGGQRQRLAIARAVLLEPAILLLDDPTAAIDSQTEHEIFTALEQAISGRTAFIVAHRLSTLRRADFIIVMEAGRIVQRGTHAELMRVPGPYRRVAQLQLVDPAELQQLATTEEIA
ncbi:ABC transporter ATP-binding protein [Opitutus terrae]|uniref:ABC transporter related n=1 Tax=Opitutus terrae (strain DSM 11246 / JCM 15787 / PB90-1) TaxID=452637 RepID=B1ZWS3_OPITP|nr:ABC transporter ATP-binding protein [Opitutus terrae]ACB74200.1 ABC transporter related [Opitutus terrae PB90-1]